MSTSARRTPAFLSVTAIALALLVALVRGLAPFSEPDTWWHLLVGEHILRTHQIAAHDPWAAFADKPYVATQWLTEAATAKAYELGGLGAVLWLRVLAILSLALWVYAACRRLGGRLPAALATGTAVLGASASLNPRPQLVSFVLFAVVVLAWIGSSVDSRPRWWLVPVFWLWACSHGLWMFGIVVGLVTSAALVLAVPRERRRGLATRLGLLNLATVAAVCATPLGPRVLLAPFTVATNAAGVAEEWAPTPLNNAFSITTFAMIVATAALWLLRPTRRPLWHHLWLGLSAALMLMMWRLVPLGAILCAPLFASALGGVLSSAREPVSRGERRGLLAGFAAGIAVAALICATPAGPRAFQYPTSMGAIDRALAQAPKGSVVMTDFGVSGWLLWRHPELVPTADLRMEIYPQDYLTRYLDAGNAKPGWPAYLDSVGAHYALLERTSALTDALVHERHWRAATGNARFVLLEAPEEHLDG